MQASQASKGPEKQEVRVKRSFYFNGKPTKVGDTVELPRIFASEMIAAHKAEAIAAKAEDKPKVDNKPVSDEKVATVEKKGGANAR